MDKNLNTKSGMKAATPNTSERSNKSFDVKDDVIGGASAGGVAGTGGVSTNDVGLGRAKKNPLTER